MRSKIQVKVSRGSAPKGDRDLGVFQRQMHRERCLSQADPSGLQRPREIGQRAHGRTVKQGSQICFRRFSAALLENRWAGGRGTHTGVKGFFLRPTREVETPGITVGLYGGGKVEEMPQVLPQVSSWWCWSPRAATEPAVLGRHRSATNSGTEQVYKRVPAESTACSHRSFSRKRK